ncbi:hypothetical protein [Rhodovulum adriaticum]|uniref:Lipoprotein n=1 Tax=Rhodovulum adriaticum TaxID=35804 RepID=A0A4V2SLZ4_RHOAD|nr:hypothetical protein [Rhodovulum adriaticum]MBK1635108.1 hypothetical protein [Rhodovulum adriaticum]TCP25256.1 hypothetical protein EV656_1035 [Rhodovulum adriaticum]
MRAPLVILLSASLGLAACSTVKDSRLNPFNWFGNSQETRVRTAPASEQPAKADPRQLVAEITALTIERIPGGAILRATGLPPRQGYWNAALVPVPDEREGLRVYDLRAEAPTGQTPVGQPQSRAIDVALYLSDQDLAPIRQIVVRGAQNQRSTRR